jgi:hypothetical protein
METLIAAVGAAPSGLLVHLGAACQLAGFLMRDQLKLRALLLAGGLLYILYYLTQPTAPLWEAAFWSGLMAAANIVMIVLIARSRRPMALTDDALRLHGFFTGVEPGDFRRIMALASVSAASAPLRLTTLGERAHRLFHVTEGAVEIAREEGVIRRAAPLFIGELGYLLDRPASATVTLLPGGRALTWDSAGLHALCARRPQIGQAIERALNRDLAVKVLDGARTGANAAE